MLPKGVGPVGRFFRCQNQTLQKTYGYFFFRGGLVLESKLAELFGTTVPLRFESRTNHKSDWFINSTSYTMYIES